MYHGHKPTLFGWKKSFYELCEQKRWDEGVVLMEEVIRGHPDCLDAYLLFLYFFMDVLLEHGGPEDKVKRDYYWDLAIHYFHVSYEKFRTNPEYLFFAGICACPAEWFFDVDLKVAVAMIESAWQMEPENFIYQSDYHLKTDKTHRENVRQAQLYARAFLQPDAPHRKYLQSKGHLGEYFLGMKDNWCREMFERYPNLIDGGRDDVICTFPFHDDTSGT